MWNCQVTGRKKRSREKYRIMISGAELSQYMDKRIATVYYFKRSKIVKKIVFD